MTATAVISTPLKWSHFRNERSQEQPINSETCSHYQSLAHYLEKGQTDSLEEYTYGLGVLSFWLSIHIGLSQW